MARFEESRKVSPTGHQRPRGDSGGSDISTSDSGSSLSYPLTYLVTPIEAYRVQLAFSKVGLVQRPQKEISTSLTNPPTPTPSYPNTPVTGLPPKSSPFTPFSSISSEEPTNRPDVKPTLSIAIKNSFNDDVLPQTTRTALRAFVVGWFLNYFLQTVIPTIRGRRSPRAALFSILSLSHKRIGVSLALFAFFYRTLSYYLNYIRLKVLSSLPSLAPTSLPTASYRARLLARMVRLIQGSGVVPFIAALLATPTLLLLPSQMPKQAGAKTFPRKAFALDLFTKGLRFHFNLLRQRKSRAVNWVPNWCDSTLLYAIGNGQLLWSFIFEPECFPKGYGDLILSRSSAYIPPRPEDLPSAIPWPSRREIGDHVALLSTPTKTSSAFPNFVSPSLSALQPSPFPTTKYDRINPVLDFSPAHPAHSQLLCALLHPIEPSCRRNYLKSLSTEWTSSARFVSFFLAAVNVLKWRSWKKDPEGSLFRLAMGVIQGATIISGSIGSAWALTCAFQHYFPRNFLPRSRYFLNGFLSSVFIFAVPASRRTQLSLYLARMSMDSSWQILKKQKKVKSLWNGDVLLLGLGLAFLASIREEAPAALSGYPRRILQILTGPRLAGSSTSSAGLPLDSNGNSSSSQWQSSPAKDFGLSLTPASLGRRKAKTG